MQWKSTALAFALSTWGVRGLPAETLRERQYATAPMLRFSCSQLVIDRLDPLVQPGAIPSVHLHQVVGGNSFNATMTPVTDDPSTLSTCTSCTFNEDFSNYWTANLFYKATNGSFKRVPQMVNLGLQGNAGVTVYYIPRKFWDIANGGRVHTIQHFLTVDVLFLSSCQPAGNRSALCPRYVFHDTLGSIAWYGLQQMLTVNSLRWSNQRDGFSKGKLHCFAPGALCGSDDDSRASVCSLATRYSARPKGSRSSCATDASATFSKIRLEAHLAPEMTPSICLCNSAAAVSARQSPFPR